MLPTGGAQNLYWSGSNGFMLPLIAFQLGFQSTERLGVVPCTSMSCIVLGKYISGRPNLIWLLSNALNSIVMCFFFQTFTGGFLKRLIQRTFLECSGPEK